MSGYVPVRLCDVPQNVRYAAVRRIIRKDPSATVDLIIAATHPSEKTYWLPASCKTLVESLTENP